MPTAYQDTKPLVKLPEVPETLSAQVEKQVERLQSKEDNSVDLLEARRRFCSLHKNDLSITIVMEVL